MNWMTAWSVVPYRKRRIEEDERNEMSRKRSQETEAQEADVKKKMSRTDRSNELQMNLTSRPPRIFLNKKKKKTLTFIYALINIHYINNFINTISCTCTYAYARTPRRREKKGHDKGTATSIQATNSNESADLGGSCYESIKSSRLYHSVSLDHV